MNQPQSSTSTPQSPSSPSTPPTTPGPETFPILEQLTFFNHAGVSCISGPAAQALRWYAEQSSNYAYTKAGHYKRLDEIKSSVAKLINARGAHEIAYIPNTSTGIALVAEGIDWKAGDQVVITNVEYPANRYPWENLKRRGVEVVEVAQSADARIHVEDVVNAITDRTRCVALSHVQYASGHRIDLAPIAQTVHEVGGYLCVDAIQSTGLLPVDVQAMGADFVAADSHKWLLGPEGAGFLYVHEDLIQKIHPAIVGWMNMVDAMDFGSYNFTFQNDARRFEPGSYNVPGLLAMGASVDMLMDVGIENVWQKVEQLTARLHAGLESKGYRVYSPREHADERSGILIFEPPADKPEPKKIVGQLMQQGIVIVVREGRLRASPHFYNTFEQIDRLIEALP